MDVAAGPCIAGQQHQQEQGDLHQTLPRTTPLELVQAELSMRQGAHATNLRRADAAHNSTSTTRPNKVQRYSHTSPYCRFSKLCLIA